MQIEEATPEFVNIAGWVRGAWLCLAVAVTLGCASGDDRFPGTLEIDVQASRAGTVRLFADSAVWFAGEAPAVAPLADTRAAQTLRFPLRMPARQVRLGLFDGPGSMKLLAMRFVPQVGAVVPLPFRVQHAAEIARIEHADAAVAITTTADAGDPSVVLSTGALRHAVLPRALQPITPSAIMIAGAGLAMLTALSAAAVLRTAMRTAGDARGHGTWPVASALAGAGFLVLGAKLWLIAAFGSGVPYLDQWKVEAIDTYLPYAWGELRWGDLLVPHNEHRIAPSRLLALWLLVTDGRWNPLLEQVVNALLHTTVAVLLAALLWMRAGRRLLFPIAAIVTLAFALPFASENTLNGSQSCLYFVLFGLVVPLALMPGARPASAPWWLALAVLALGVVAFAGGSLNVVCLAVGLALARTARRSWRPLAMDLAACALVAAVALALRAPSPPAHAAYVASDVRHFSLLAFGALAFPFVREPTMAAVVWIPSMLLVGSLLRERRMPDPLEGTLLALAAWVFVQAAAIGYSRGNLSSVPPSRYLDVFSFVFVINMVAAVWLARGRAPAAATLPRVVIAAWGGVVLLGLAQQAHVDVVHFAAVRGTDATAHRENIRRYLATGDREWFAGLTFPHEVPVQVPALLSEVLLADPFLRARLPPALGEPLALRASREGPGPFRREGVRPPATTDALADAWGSYDGHDGAGVGLFRSRSIACSWGALVRVDVAGELNDGNMELRMVTDAGRIRRLASTFLPSGRWQPVWARCPPGPFRIVARDWDSAHWFAVGSPIEYGWLSFLAEAALARVWLPLAVGALLAAWAVVAASRPA